MLGRPAVDPHGDPIPDPDGAIARPRYESLLTCPLDTPVVLSRVTDQDAAFLRFLESHDLTPGQSLRVAVRDEAADHVQVCIASDRAVMIGMRAAAKLLVAPGG